MKDCSINESVSEPSLSPHPEQLRDTSLSHDSLQLSTSLHTPCSPLQTSPKLVLTPTYTIPVSSPSHELHTTGLVVALPTGKLLYQETDVASEYKQKQSSKEGLVKKRLCDFDWTEELRTELCSEDEDSSLETKDIENEVSKENSGEKYTSGSEESTERFSDRICIKCKTSLQTGWLDRWTGTYYCGVSREEEIEGESQ